MTETQTKRVNGRHVEPNIVNILPSSIQTTLSQNEESDEALERISLLEFEITETKSIETWLLKLNDIFVDVSGKTDKHENLSDSEHLANDMEDLHTELIALKRTMITQQHHNQ